MKKLLSLLKTISLNQEYVKNQVIKEINLSKNSNSKEIMITNKNTDKNQIIMTMMNCNMLKIKTNSKVSMVALEVGLNNQVHYRTYPKSMINMLTRLKK